MKRILNRLIQAFSIDFLKSAGINLVIKVLGTGASFLLQVGLARALSLEAYGSYTFIMAWVGVLSFIPNLGFTTSTMRFIPEYVQKKQYRELWGVVRTSIAVTFCLASALSLIGGIIIYFVKETDSGSSSFITYLLALGIFFLFSFMRLFQGIEKGKKRMFMAHAPFMLFRHVLIGLGVAAFWYFEKSVNVNQALAVVLLAMLLLVCWHFLALKKGLPQKCFAFPPVYKIKEWLKVSFPLLISGAFFIILNQSSVIMLGIFSGKAEVGIFNVAYKVSGLVGFIFFAVNAISTPVTSELFYQNKAKELQKFAKQIAHLIFWPTLVISIGLIVFSTFVLHLFGEEYTAAKSLVFIMLGGQVIRAFFGPVGNYLNMTGNQNDSAKVIAIAAVLAIVLNPIGIYFWGVTGSAIVTAVITIFWSTWLFILVRKRIGINSTLF